MKSLTKNCEGCPHLAEGKRAFREILQNIRKYPVLIRVPEAMLLEQGGHGIEEKPVKLCLWGVATKVLVAATKPRACEYRGRKSPRE